jgi:hypothetical protein
VQKSDFQEKSQKILQKSYFIRRPTEPEEETKRGWELGATFDGSRQSLCVVNDQPVGNPKRKV